MSYRPTLKTLRAGFGTWFLIAGATLGIYDAFITEDFMGFWQTSPTWFIQQFSGNVDAVGESTLINIPIKLFFAVLFLILGYRLLHE